MIVSAQEFCSTQYDYLIIGGGLAGLVLATRLAEDPAIKVGVVEAGDWVQDDPHINIPGYYGRSLFDPNVTWGFSSTPQPALDGRVLSQTRGKGLGGSSLVNFMLCGRGSSDEYDSWSSELSFAGWNWDSLLPYFRKAERLSVPGKHITKDGQVKPSVQFHGQNGSLPQSYPLWTENELSVKFLETCEGLGFGINTDAANGKNIGASIPISTIDSLTGHRASAAAAYYAPVHSSRPNLHVCLKAQAHRIVFTNDIDQESGGKGITASGVEFAWEDNVYVAKAKGEVILSSGAFQSPRLLELSGIGAKRYTEDLGIKQRVNLPGVGENLEDHILCPQIFEIDPKFSTQDPIYTEQGLKKQLDLLDKSQSGILSMGPTGTICTLPLAVSDRESIEKIIAAVKSSKGRAQKNGTLATKHHELFERWINDPQQGILEYILVPGHFGGPGEPGRAYFAIVPVLLHSLSRGSTHIASADPMALPIIDPQYASEESDLLLLVEAAKTCKKIAHSGPLGETVKKDVFPPENADLEKHVKAHVETCYHTGSTCIAGAREDGAVVDSELKVFGTTNLRVVDASVIPILPSHHLQMTVYAIAEKAADMIKQHRNW